MELRPATKGLQFRIACPLRPVIIDRKPAMVHISMLSCCVGSIARDSELFNYLEVLRAFVEGIMAPMGAQA